MTEILENLKTRKVKVFTKGNLKFEGIVTGISPDFIEIFDEKTGKPTLINLAETTNIEVNGNDRATEREPTHTSKPL